MARTRCREADVWHTFDSCFLPGRRHRVHLACTLFPTVSSSATPRPMLVSCWNMEGLDGQSYTLWPHFRSAVCMFDGG